MRHRLRVQSSAADVDMTPMLDIVFILLIFFIVTSTFVQEAGVQLVAPPRSDKPTGDVAETILVQVDGTNAIFVNGRLTDPARVTAAIARLNVDTGGQSAVAIQPHPDSEHGMVTRAFDAALAAHVVNVIMRPPEQDTD